MVAIMEKMHAYVPTTSSKHEIEEPRQQEKLTVTTDNFHYTLFGKFQTA